MKEIKTISGYKLKDPKFDKKASDFLWPIQKRGADGKRKRKDWPHRLFAVGSAVHKAMFEAGVLDLYFEPVYKEQLYYIQNTDAGFTGDIAIFCTKDNKGYTCDLNDSAKFTFEQAKQIHDENPARYLAWPIEYIDGSKGIQRVMGIQHMNHEDAEKALELESEKQKHWHHN